jgi:uncharacterized protein (DUF58 family)
VSTATTRLLDPAVLARYDGLTFHVAHGMGERAGDRRFPGRPQPSGIELESYSAYAPGDDLRHLDWNAVGRLDALLVRRFTAEREVVFDILLDCSASMDAPMRDGKLAAATELAMAAAYIALTANDAVRIVLLGTDPPRVSSVYRQRASALRAAELLSAATAAGTVGIGVALERWAATAAQPGTAIVISDFMSEPDEIARGVDALRARRFEVRLLHVIGERELDPRREFSHAVLADVESDATHPMVLTDAALARYQALLASHLDALAALATRARATYARCTTATPAATFVTTELPRLGVLRRR